MAIETSTRTCYRHPDRETGVSCSNCGRPICPDCMTPTPVGMRCPECARERTPVRTIRNIRAEPVVTYALIAINVVAWIAEVVAAAGSGLRDLAQARRPAPARAALHHRPERQRCRGDPGRPGGREHRAGHSRGDRRGEEAVGGADHQRPHLALISRLYRLFPWRPATAIPAGRRASRARRAAARSAPIA